MPLHFPQNTPPSIFSHLHRPPPSLHSRNSNLYPLYPMYLSLLMKFPLRHAQSHNVLFVHSMSLARLMSTYPWCQNSLDVHLITTTPHYQVGIVRLSNSKHWLLSTWSIYWQQGFQHCLPFTPSTPPFPRIFPWVYVLGYFLSSRERCVCPVCVMSTVHVNCVVCGGLSMRTCDCKVGSTHFATACSVMSRVYSTCAWFVEGRPNPIKRRVLMTRNRTLSPHNLCREPLLLCARASTQRWRKGRSKRRDSRFVFTVRASRLWEVVLREVVLQTRLFERSCYRETFLRKTVLWVPTKKLSS